MYDLSAHKGRGILPGDFIKPDPALTRLETRNYVLTELGRWLDGDIVDHAMDIAEAGLTPDDVAIDMASGLWPAARLFSVVRALEKSHMAIHLPADTEDRFFYAARWARDVCTDHLCGYYPGNPVAILASGFVANDLLPNGLVIEGYWNHTPFTALRSSPPLSDDGDYEEPEPEPEVEPEVETVRPSIDSSLDTITDFMTSNISFRAPGWVLVAVGSLVAGYFATAVAMCSAKRI